MNLAPYSGTHLRWSFSRHQKPFVVRVVEPTNYEPGSHGELFDAALTAMIERPRASIDTYAETAPRPDPRQFDLVTFPEAFIDGETLIAALEIFRMCGPSGCVHTGLRAKEGDAARHLFRFEEVCALKKLIEKTLPSAKEDLRGFSAWLYDQNTADRFNLGCLFLNDAEGETRICLHPKLVRSKFEISPFREESMCEANLLTLVTLEPQQKQFGTITLQPLICSDALSLETDAGGDAPIAAVNRFAGCLGDAPPDHVDIVSVATCTPQAAKALTETNEVRIWHERFRTSFLAAAREPQCARHHFAATVLANFQEIGIKPAGLSGVFLPIAANPVDLGPGVDVWLWGRPIDGDPDNRWSKSDEGGLSEWQSRGFIAGLTPDASAAARIFGFAIQRLPREASPWEPQPPLTQLQIHESVRGSHGALTFRHGATYA